MDNATNRETHPDRHQPTHRVVGDNPALRPLVAFAAVALPSGWVLLGVPVAAGVPVAPFVLATLLIGLVGPAVVLTRREPGASMKALLRDSVRIPRQPLLLVAALVLIPSLTWSVATATGHAPTLDGQLVVGALVNVLSSVAIVNLWEELAWQGFFQRRATSRWGYARGAAVTAAMFVGVHLALALPRAEDVGDVGRGVAALVVSGIGLRLLLGALDSWSGRSILTVAVAHASFNVASRFVDPDGDWIRYLVTLALGLAALGVFLAAPPAGVTRHGATAEVTLR